jgi:DNA-binding NarL/FixJ family response regulator
MIDPDEAGPGPDRERMLRVYAARATAGRDIHTGQKLPAADAAEVAGEGKGLTCGGWARANQVCRARRAAAVSKARLARLPKRARAVMELWRLGWTYESIAGRLGVSFSTVTNQVHASLARLGVKEPRRGG